MGETKVYIRPFFEGPDTGEGGIRRWVEAQRRLLPKYGTVPVPQEDQADVVVCHAGDVVNTARPLVVHNHGLYATGEQAWSRFEWLMNRNVIELLRRADIATVPSNWVATQVARGMNLSPRVLYAGIEPAKWYPESNEGYVLWNKTRVDAVCDPAPVGELARLRPNARILTTFGPPGAPNVRVTGKLPFEEAAMLIRHANAYLSTTRETFGIATLEAMASEVPVLGFAWGGNLDIVEHGKTGWLVPPGDYAALAEGLDRINENRKPWGEAARAAVIGRFTWDRAVQQCAGMYGEAADLGRRAPKVSIIVTCYKLEEYLGFCLMSLQSQSSKDWECIVIDDCSPVDEERNCAALVGEYAAVDPRIRYIRTPQNLYLAGARNYGIAHSQGKYILPLDADDMLAPNAVEVLSDFLDKQPGVAIAYGAMTVLEPDGRRWDSSWPPATVSWELQLAHRNQIPYASMYRRIVWERLGGYRERCTTAEDADFWCRAFSYGFRAVRPSNYPCLISRNRPESMSKSVPEPDWTAWYPWRRDRLEPARAVTDTYPVPFAAIGQTVNGLSWPVPLYTKPRVTVIIPVGPGHERLVADALDSVLAQTVADWECIVVNDTGTPLDLKGWPWVKLLQTEVPASGPAVARNIGVAASTTPLFVCLDADDYLMPGFLAAVLNAHAQHGGYVYTDWFEVHKDGSSDLKVPGPFTLDGLMHALPWTVTALVSKADWAEVGGFDPKCGQWEDWDFFFALGTREVCGTYVQEPLFCYRQWTGMRREKAYVNKRTNIITLRQKWGKWIAKGGARFMACSGCRKGGGATATARRDQGTSTMRAVSQGEVNRAKAADSGMVLIEYIGGSLGTTYFRGRSGQSYSFGATETERRKLMFAADAPTFLQRKDFRQVDLSPKPEVVQSVTPPSVRQSDNRLKPVEVGSGPR